MKWPAMFDRQRRDRELREELDAHLQMATADRIARGEAPDDAHAAARRQFGNVAVVTDVTRSVWAWVHVEQLLQDLRFGARILTTSPALSATCVLLIALVIGGNTTVFSMVHTLVKKPAAGVENDRLVVVSQAGRPGSEISYPELLDYQAASGLERLTAFGFERVTLEIDGGVYGVATTLVRADYFDTLGVRLARGRAISEEEHMRGAPLAIVVSHRLWRDQLRQDANVIGRALIVNGLPATVVGVASPGFRGAFMGEMSDLWVPLEGYFRARGREAQLDDRADARFVVIGRLREHVAIDDVQVEVATIARRLQIDHPLTNKDRLLLLAPYTMAAGTLIGDRSDVFLGVFSIVTLLTLFIVSANVANLMLARSVVRQRETAVRQSLGASRLRIVRMLVAEGLVLALASWLVACALAVAVSKLVLRLLPPGREGMVLDPNFMPDWQVMAYAMVLAAIATLTFTLAPALRAWRQDVLQPLKAGEQSVAQGRSRLSSGLVVVQLGFSVVLLTTAGLALRSVSLIGSLDLGFDAGNVMLVGINIGAETESRAVNLALIDRLLTRFDAVPGVAATSYARNAPSFGPAEFRVRASAAHEPLRIRRQVVGSRYLSVLGIAPVAGREFLPSDTLTSKPVVMVNQFLADALWPGQSAIGQTLLVGAQGTPAEVIGVTPNVLFEGFRREPRPSYVLMPDAQMAGAVSQPAFYLRHTLDLATMAPAITAAVRDVDVSAPVVWQVPLTERLYAGSEPLRIVSTLLMIFSIGSLLVAGIGQYAVVAFDMRRRTREFGVRVALGASASQVVATVIREALVLTLIGSALGFALSAAAGGALSGFWYGVTPTDPITYLAVLALLATASLVACYVPARRAATVNPVEALRQE